ncbi:MAG: hypothetical protein ACOYXU_13675 [Nitrospirota bacterium]
MAFDTMSHAMPVDPAALVVRSKNIAGTLGEKREDGSSVHEHLHEPPPIVLCMNQTFMNMFMKLSVRSGFWDPIS